jgi:hypothetical protein
MAHSKGRKAEMEFHTEAKHVISQEIPIFNSSSDDWPIKACLEGSYFTAPLSINAKAGVVTNYPIMFQPSTSCEVNGSLVLTNINTTQKNTYVLKGIARDLDPEEVFDITVKARSRFEQKFLVKNSFEEDTVFDIVTDLPISRGTKELFVPALSSASHTLQFQPLTSGSFK